MADQIKSDVATHYPIHPFGKHAGTYAISITLARNYEGDPIPLSGCTLEEPLDDNTKTMLCGLALARIDSGGRFEVDYAALRAHLRTVCGVRDEDLPGLTWASIVRTIHKNEPDVPAPSESPVAGSMTGEQRAMAILATHPDWSDVRIAREAGLHPKSLPRYTKYQMAKKIVKEAARADLPRGFKTKDGDLEAYE